ncbi:hypothetical protein [Aestuariibacter salexigens]|uniref:hypothetical protein n=1 Tax=Aestuariibacter salexigens TaxID=226010 RepID=UPI0004158293|nr:hypothetical protein [Aestuariibacter salexigens]
MHRSSRGFGLTGVAIAVIVMIITAVFSTSAKSSSHIEFEKLIASSGVTACCEVRD